MSDNAWLQSLKAGDTPREHPELTLMRELAAAMLADAEGHAEFGWEPCSYCAEIAEIKDRLDLYGVLSAGVDLDNIAAVSQRIDDLVRAAEKPKEET